MKYGNENKPVEIDESQLIKFVIRIPATWNDVRLNIVVVSPALFVDVIAILSGVTGGRNPPHSVHVRVSCPDDGDDDPSEGDPPHCWGREMLVMESTIAIWMLEI